LESGESCFNNENGARRSREDSHLIVTGGDLKSPTVRISSKSQRENANKSEAVDASAAQDNTVVHKDRNGTITVKSTKTVGKSNYSFVSVSPT